MLKLNLILLPMMAVLMLTGCGSSAIKAAPGQEFRLTVAQTAEITGEDLKVTFDDVTEDSRCPTGVVCIWEGRVVSKMTVQKAGASGELILTEPGLTSNPTTQEYQGYVYSFRVEPYPAAGQPIAKGDYRMIMSVARK